MHCHRRKRRDRSLERKGLRKPICRNSCRIFKMASVYRRGWIVIPSVGFCFFVCSSIPTGHIFCSCPLIGFHRDSCLPKYQAFISTRCTTKPITSWKGLGLFLVRMMMSPLFVYGGAIGLRSGGIRLRGVIAGVRGVPNARSSISNQDAEKA